MILPQPCIIISLLYLKSLFLVILDLAVRGEHFGMSLSGLMDIWEASGIAIGMAASKDVMSNLFRCYALFLIALLTLYWALPA